MEIQDDRTPEQRETLSRLIVGTDSFLSGWGEAENGTSFAAWACDPSDWRDCMCWVENRRDMKRVRIVDEVTPGAYKPRGRGHLHIYVWDRPGRVRS